MPRIHCTVNTNYCTVNINHCTVSRIHYAMNDIHCTENFFHCTVNRIHCAVNDIQKYAFTVQCHCATLSPGWFRTQRKKTTKEYTISKTLNKI